MNDEFEQRYDASLAAPVPVWLFCRLCRCRIQVRTIPRPSLPFRCFCGNAGTFAQFDVFSQEDDVVRFVKTFEELYQETKQLLKEAEMAMPQTQVYRPGELKKLMAQESVDPARLEQTADESSDLGRQDAGAAKDRVRELKAAVQNATDPIARHEALCELGKHLYAHRGQDQETRRLCYQACEADMKAAREVIREATARHRAGGSVRLRFPLMKRLVALLVEDHQLERALDVAQRAVALGIPGYEDKVARIREQLGKRG